MQRWLITTTATMMMTAGLGCAGFGARGGERLGEDGKMIYTAPRVDTPVKIDADWDKPAWNSIKPLTLTHSMRPQATHTPNVQAKVAYDDEALYVIFRVEDQYVRAVAEKHHDPVCKDSCVEFFFTPGTDTKVGYFNLEMNCGGTMLFNFQLIAWENQQRVAPEILDRVERATTMDRIVDPEITDPTTWVAEYRLPVDWLKDYCPEAVMPAPGVEWRANFYKCADATSHPHWLTWSKVNKPKPNFHVPECFGTLRFE